MSRFEDGFRVYTEIFPTTKGEPQLFEAKAWSLLEPKPVVTYDSFKTVKFPKIKSRFS